jgi:hypothetical protein
MSMDDFPMLGKIQSLYRAWSRKPPKNVQEDPSYNAPDDDFDSDDDADYPNDSDYDIL